VEVYFRDLKCTLKMGRPRAKDVAGVRKEVLAFVKKTVAPSTPRARPVSGRGRGR
jgi:hypothetical protein